MTGSTTTEACGKPDPPGNGATLMHSLTGLGGKPDPRSDGATPVRQATGPR
ncbi:MAG TPA: hypothetical protein VGC09_06535 [Rhodopila sp.]